MKDIICKIINEWDPVGIKAITPDDEYDFEVSQIESAIANDENITEKVLTEIINNIFVEKFGSDVFVANKKDIGKIASKIIACYKEIKEKQ